RATPKAAPTAHPRANAAPIFLLSLVVFILFSPFPFAALLEALNPTQACFAEILGAGLFVD
ncbi:MAG: hypothetical protein MUC83_05880, partial [Pirellula sp.]|nr:hypothetical protein [Pirellula sp.]